MKRATDFPLTGFSKFLAERDPKIGRRTINVYLSMARRLLRGDARSDETALRKVVATLPEGSRSLAKTAWTLLEKYTLPTHGVVLPSWYFATKNMSTAPIFNPAFPERVARAIHDLSANTYVEEFTLKTLVTALRGDVHFYGRELNGSYGTFVVTPRAKKGGYGKNVIELDVPLAEAMRTIFAWSCNLPEDTSMADLKLQHGQVDGFLFDAAETGCPPSVRTMQRTLRAFDVHVRELAAIKRDTRMLDQNARFTPYITAIEKDKLRAAHETQDVLTIRRVTHAVHSAASVRARDARHKAMRASETNEEIEARLEHEEFGGG